MTTEPADLRAFHADRVAEFRANGGRLNPPLDAVPLLVLTTIGARSGRPHATPMTYTRDGDRLIVIAAAGGAPTHPAWYHNLRANPAVTVEIGTDTYAATATIPAGAERDRLLAWATDAWPLLIEHQATTALPIPLVVLQRQPNGAAA